MFSRRSVARACLVPCVSGDTVTDPELVTAAVEAIAGGNNTTFGLLIGHKDGRDVAAWRRGRTGVSSPVRLLMRMAIAHPRAIRRWLEEASA